MEGTSPTTNGAGGGGGVATLIAGLAHPNPRQGYGFNFHQGVPRQTFSFKKKKKKRKETRLRTVRRCQAVRSCLLHILSVSGHCLLQKERKNIRRIQNKAFSSHLLQVTCLLTALQRAQAWPPTEPEAEEVLQRWSRAYSPPPPLTPGSNTVVIFTKGSLVKASNSLFLLKRQRTVSKKMERNKTTQHTKMPGSPRQTFFCSWKGTKTSAERDVDSHVSLRNLEKELISVLREMPSRTFLLGNWKNSG